MSRSRAERIWLDITDVYDYARGGNTAVSGIQRVVANLLLRCDLSPVPVAPLLRDTGDGRSLALDLDRTRALMAALQGDGTAETIRTHVSAVAESVRETRLGAGDMIVLVGAFWVNPNVDRLADLRRGGVVVATLFYDLIPATHRHFVNRSASVEFAAALLDVVAITDIALSISHYVAGELREFLRDRLEADLPVRAVALPTELPAARETSSPIEPEAMALGGRDFVLCVGTLDIRKNNAYLVEIWRRLAAEGVALPKLVLVGKWGWGIDALRREIDEGLLADHLVVFNQLSDAGLDHLYRHCLFTAYVSFAEGWGLPVGESLAHGKACIASHATSIPEVGGDFVRYVDPHSVEDGLRAFREVLADRAGLAAWSRRIRDGFRPKDWPTYVAEFYAALLAGDAATSRPARMTHALPAATMMPLGSDDIGRLDFGAGQLGTPRMARVSGWKPVEQWGAWAREPEAVLHFGTALAGGTPIVVFCRVRMAETVAATTLVTVTVGGEATRVGQLAETDSYVRATGRVSDDGTVRIVFICRSEPHAGIRRNPSYLGLAALGYCAVDDVDARLALMETVSVDLSRHAASAGDAAGADIPVGSEAAGLRRLYFGDLGARPSVLTAPFRAVVLMLARRAARRGRFADAERWYAKLLRLDPSRPRVWIQYAHALKQQGDLEAALSAYLLATKADPGFADAYLQLGTFLRFAGQPDAANRVIARGEELADGGSDKTKKPKGGSPGTPPAR